MTGQHIQLTTLEAEARALGLDIQRHEEQGQPLARRAFELYARYEAARARLDNVIRPGFKNWFSALTGVPEGSVFYYVELGAALAARLDQPEEIPSATPDRREESAPPAEGSEPPSTRPPSARDLRAAGSALLSGAPKSEVRKALQQGRVQDYAAARRGEGLVSVRLALPAKEIWDEQTRRWCTLTGLPQVEAQALMVTATQYMNDYDIKALARAGEVRADE
ncbi:hypothetical protein ACFP81_06500 [Deinococcus lacus]|uniref:Uncharacterized protein n=1 Tax=Deinococcus lacus TaxID=392561 RepID=A0ABW1YCC7_9DEIO